MQFFKHFFISITLFTGLIQAETVARVMKMSGNVLFKRLGQTSFSEKASLGAEVNNGDAIKVGEQGFAAIIYIDNKSIIKLKPNTQFEIMDTRSTRSVNIEFGTILNEVQKSVSGKTFRVETPVSVASVKGTEFACIVDPSGVDQFVGREGLFDVMNKATGQTVSVSAGQKAISDIAGNVMQAPASPTDYPSDPEADVPTEETPPSEREEEPETESIEEPQSPDPVEQPERIPEPEEPSEPETPEEPENEATDSSPETNSGGEAPEPESGTPDIQKPPKPFGMGLGIGSATVDGVLYNQLALRPEINIGKIGVGLDLVVYIDNNGNVREDEWAKLREDPSMILDKIMFIRYGSAQDPFWLKWGALENVTLGYGGLVQGYSNMMEYPSIKKTGIQTGFNFGPVGGELFMGNIKDFSRGGTLIGFRSTYTVSENFPLRLGLSYVTDVNQFSGLKDKDDDFIPDIFDDFPDNNLYSKDTDGDGIADNDTLELDVDGDGLTDWIYPGMVEGIDDTVQLDENITLKIDPFSLENNKSSANGFSVDIGYPVFSNKLFSFDIYSEFNSLSFPEVVSTDSDTFRIKRSGTGITAPGIRTRLAFINLSLEYRMISGSYVPQFFDQGYDLNRVSTFTTGDTTVVKTKDMLVFENVDNTTTSTGYFGSASFNIFNIVDFVASYANMKADTVEINSFTAYLNLNTENIPKLSMATAYYQRNNDENPFDFENPTVNTVMGYKVGYELSKGVSLIWDYKQYYQDIGNGLEPIQQTTIETAFSF